MGSLLGYLEKVKNLPPRELSMSLREGGEESRWTEMALLDGIIPSSKVSEIRKKPGGYWITRCCDLIPTRIKFQLTTMNVKGGTKDLHIIVVSSVNGELRVVDNNDVLNFTTDEELRGHILSLAGVE